MAQFVELDIDQGTDFSFNLDITEDDGSAINIASYSFSSSIRKSYYSTSAAANLTVTIPDAANGNVLFSLNSATTANIKSGRYLIDVKQTDGSNVKTRLMEGVITFNPQVTK
jgi:hypothetical protein